nr:unnamed protein product [Digitaria exilis]
MRTTGGDETAAAAAQQEEQLIFFPPPWRRRHDTTARGRAGWRKDLALTAPLGWEAGIEAAATESQDGSQSGAASTMTTKGMPLERRGRRGGADHTNCCGPLRARGAPTTRSGLDFEIRRYLLAVHTTLGVAVALKAGLLGSPMDMKKTAKRKTLQGAVQMKPQPKDGPKPAGFCLTRMALIVEPSA